MIETKDLGPIRFLRLAHPPANALGPELTAAFSQALDDAVADGARAVVLAGAPGMFSAGLDLPALIHLDRPAMQAAWEDFFGMLRRLAALPVPIAAAITGHSPAGGAVLALFCDYRILAAGKFKIGLNEVRVGLALPELIYHALELVVGRRRAELLAVTGQLVEPEEALRLGLVDEVVEPEAVETRALAWCEDLLAIPPQAMAATRKLARAPLVALFEGDLMTRRIEQTLDDWFSEDTQANIRAVVERLKSKKK